MSRGSGDRSHGGTERGAHSDQRRPLAEGSAADLGTQAVDARQPYVSLGRYVISSLDGSVSLIRDHFVNKLRMGVKVRPYPALIEVNALPVKRSPYDTTEEALTGLLRDQRPSLREQMQTRQQAGVSRVIVKPSVYLGRGQDAKTNYQVQAVVSDYGDIDSAHWLEPELVAVRRQFGGNSSQEPFVTFLSIWPGDSARRGYYRY